MAPFLLLNTLHCPKEITPICPMGVGDTLELTYADAVTAGLEPTALRIVAH